MPSRVRVRRAVALLLLMGALALAACEVRGEVAVRVDDDGAGEVEVTAAFDRDAARRLGDPATELALDDLAAGGWTVEGPGEGVDGAFEVSAVKPFGSPEDLQTVLAEVGGDVFSGFGVSLGSGFASTEWSLDGRVRLTGSLEQFGDADLTAALDGLPLGRTPEELEAALAEGGFALSMRVELPEPVAGPEDTTGDAAGFPAPAVSWEWAVPGDAVDAEVAATATRRELAALRWFAFGLVALLLAVAVWVVGRLAARRGGGGRNGAAHRRVGNGEAGDAVGGGA